MRSSTGGVGCGPADDGEAVRLSAVTAWSRCDRAQATSRQRVRSGNGVRVSSEPGGVAPGWVGWTGEDDRVSEGSELVDVVGVLRAVSMPLGAVADAEVVERPWGLAAGRPDDGQDGAGDGAWGLELLRRRAIRRYRSPGKLPVWRPRRHRGLPLGMVCPCRRAQSCSPRTE